MSGRKTTIFNLKEKNFFYGWIIVFISAIGLFFSGPGQTYSISIFINNYVNDFGWSRLLVSSLYSIATLIAGFCLPIIGRQVDKLGHRKRKSSLMTKYLQYGNSL